jgi:hypothetical protein
MKSFSQYLLESKQVYEFKIKIVDELDDSKISKLKGALERFTVESFSAGTRTPIQESQVDFPDHKNISTTTYDVVLTYPATSFQIRQIAAESLGLHESCIRVRNLKEQEEQDINHAYDNKSGESLLGKDYDKECNQNLVGEAQKMALLKELSKVKHQGDQYKGVNEKLLAKKAPADKSATVKVDKKSSSPSVLGSRSVTLPTSKLGKF